jgi:hypothetical protein
MLSAAYGDFGVIFREVRFDSGFLDCRSRLSSLVSAEAQSVVRVIWEVSPGDMGCYQMVYETGFAQLNARRALREGEEKPPLPVNFPPGHAKGKWSHRGAVDNL